MPTVMSLFDLLLLGISQKTRADNTNKVTIRIIDVKKAFAG
jgi:hypothetical protein